MPEIKNPFSLHTVTWSQTTIAPVKIFLHRFQLRNSPASMLQIRDLKFYMAASFVALIPMKIHTDLTKLCPRSISFDTGVPEAQSSLAAPLLADPVGSNAAPIWGSGAAAGSDPAPRHQGWSGVTPWFSSAASASEVTSCCPLLSRRGRKEVTQHERGGTQSKVGLNWKQWELPARSQL